MGVQSVGNMVGRRTVPAMDTICMGDYQGLWPSQERCAECGECEEKCPYRLPILEMMAEARESFDRFMDDFGPASDPTPGG